MSDRNKSSARLMEKLGAKKDRKFSTKFYTERRDEYHNGIRYVVNIPDMEDRLVAKLRKHGIAINGNAPKTAKAAVYDFSPAIM